MRNLKFVAFALITFLLSVDCYSQNDNRLGEFLEEHFEGGERNFLEAIYQTIRFPKEARNNCGIGHLHVRLTLNKDAGLKEIEFLNPFGYGVEQEVVSVLKPLNLKWKGLGKERQIQFSIAYQLEQNPRVRGDINVTGYTINSSKTDSGCLSSQELLDKINKGLAKEKYKKIPTLWKELVRRGYENTKFIELQFKYGKEFSEPGTK